MAPVPDDVVTEIFSGASENVKPVVAETAKVVDVALPASAAAPVPYDAMERDEMNPVPPAGTVVLVLPQAKTILIFLRSIHLIFTLWPCDSGSFGAAKARKKAYIDTFKMQRTRPENMEVKCGEFSP